MVYALVTNKRQGTYEEIFKAILDIEPAINPKQVMVDFERAAINAIGKTFPESEARGCFFHLGQCVWRHIQSLGMQTIYSNDSNFAWRVKHILALAFVPATNVVAAYDSLCATEFFTPNEDNQWSNEIQWYFLYRVLLIFSGFYDYICHLLVFLDYISQFTQLF